MSNQRVVRKEGKERKKRTTITSGRRGESIVRDDREAC